MKPQAKPKIAVASVLKPLNDIRLYHKIAKTLALHFVEVELHIFAHAQKGSTLPKSSLQNIFFYRLFGAGRLHYSRLWVNIRLLYLLIKLRPNCLIITTWELIPAAICIKCLYGVALVYDVQENYVYNLRFTKVYPFYLRAVLAWVVQVAEYFLLLCKPLFLFAEYCYIDEKPKLRPFLLLENKCLHEEVQQVVTQTKLTQSTHTRLLYCGTISADYGIFDLMQWVEKLNQLEIDFVVQIIGYAPSSKTQSQLYHWAKNKPYVYLQGVDTPVPHFEIMRAIYQAEVVVMPYQVNQSYAKRIPTKLFETLAFKKLICLSPNVFWEDYLAKLPTARACFIEYRALSKVHLHWQQIKENLSKPVLLKEESTLEDIYWEAQVPRLIERFSKIMACE